MNETAKPAAVGEEEGEFETRSQRLARWAAGSGVVLLFTLIVAGAVGALISDSGNWPGLVAAGIGMAAGKQGADLGVDAWQAFKGRIWEDREKSALVLISTVLGAAIALLAYSLA